MIPLYTLMRGEYDGLSNKPKLKVDYLCQGTFISALRCFARA